MDGANVDITIPSEVANTISSDNPLIVTVQVDRHLGINEYVVWENGLDPALKDVDYPYVSTIGFDGFHDECAWGMINLESGVWRLTGGDGILDVRVIDFADGANNDIGTITAAGQSMDLTVPPNTTLHIRLLQTTLSSATTLLMSQIQYYQSGGYQASLNGTDNQCNMAWYGSNVVEGHYTIRAKVYDIDTGHLIATSNDVTVTLRVENDA